MTKGYMIQEGIAVLEIGEALPRSKVGVMPDIHDRWLDYIHSGISKLADKNKIPVFEKALVGIHITTKKESDRGKLWDVSNRALNLVFNNLKGIFFEDDNFKHMAIIVSGTQGENEKTLIFIGDFYEHGFKIINFLQQEAI